MGRFLGIDPLAYSGGQQVYSPYAAMGNAPGEMIDPNGERFSSVLEQKSAGADAVQMQYEGGFNLLSGGPISEKINALLSMFYRVGDVSGILSTGSTWVYDLANDYTKITQFNSGSASPTQEQSKNKDGGQQEQSEDVFFKTGIPTTMEKQVGPTCVLFALSYVSANIDGTPVSANELMTYAVKDIPGLGLRLFSNKEGEGGLSESETGLVVNKFFNTENFTSFQNAIDNGKPVFSYIIVEGGGHAVVVVGYERNNPNRLIFMDPQEGVFRREETSVFFEKRYVLIGNK